MKVDFIQVIEVAKQEVQRKYGFEIKQLKRNVVHLKNRLIDEIERRERSVDKLHHLHQSEKYQIESQLNNLLTSQKQSVEKQFLELTDEMTD